MSQKHLVKFEASGGDGDYDFCGFCVFDNEMLDIFNDVIENLPDADWPEFIHTDTDDHLAISLNKYNGQSRREVFNGFFTTTIITEGEFNTIVKLLQGTYEQFRGNRIFSYGEFPWWLLDTNYCYTKHNVSSGTMEYK